MSEGDEDAAGFAAEEVYAVLRFLARSLLSREAQHHSLQPTLLVNEAFVRLLSGANVDWKNRQHFYLLCARMMRRIVVDYFRHKRAAKRPSRDCQVPMEDVFTITDDRGEEIMAVDQALVHLQKFDPRAAQVVELRYFAGREDAQIAEILGISIRTVRRDWLASRLFLKQQLLKTGPL